MLFLALGCAADDEPANADVADLPSAPEDTGTACPLGLTLGTHEEYAAFDPLAPGEEVVVDDNHIGGFSLLLAAVVSGLGEKVATVVEGRDPNGVDLVDPAVALSYQQIAPETQGCGGLVYPRMYFDRDVVGRVPCGLDGLPVEITLHATSLTGPERAVTATVRVTTVAGPWGEAYGCATAP